MKIIGITGGTGCGKTTVLRFLEESGSYVIDCDALYHDMLCYCTPMLEAIENRFPGSIIDGRVDTKVLGSKVYGNKKELSDLSEITNTFIVDEVKKIIIKEKAAGRESLAIDAIRLFESGLSSICTRTIGVVSDREVRITRIMARDSISRQYAESRVDAQKPNEFFAEKCDLVIENNFVDINDYRHKCSVEVSKMLDEIKPEEEY